MSPERFDQSLIRLQVRPETIYVSKGRTVLATGRDGFLDNGPDHGLFVHRTRLLSRYRYLIDGQAPRSVSTSKVEQRSWLGYYIVPAKKPDGRDPTIQKVAQDAIELRLSRYVGEGVHEDVDLTNFTQDEVRFTLGLDLDADFADQDETHRDRESNGRKRRTWKAGADVSELDFDYQARHPYECS